MYISNQKNIILSSYFRNIYDFKNCKFDFSVTI